MTSASKLFSSLGVSEKKDKEKNASLEEEEEDSSEEEDGKDGEEKVLDKKKKEDGEDGEVIHPFETPSSDKWFLVPLYKTNANGKPTMWQVGFDGKELVMLFGHIGGVIRRETTEVEVKGKNSLQEQALVEARHRFLIHRRNKDYVPAGEKQRDFTPMCGNKYFDPAKEKYYNVKCWPVGTQAKIDGIRAYSTREDGEVKFISRGNKEFEHITHLNAELSPLFDFFPEGTIFDGELYNHDIYSESGFSSIQSVVKSFKNLHKRLGDIEYYIFDVYIPPSGNEPKPYNERYCDLMKAFQALDKDRKSDDASKAKDGKDKEKKDQGHIFVVSMSLAYSHEEIQAHHDAYVKIGYEGVMIRQLYYPQWPEAQRKLSEYACKRCNNILKYKKFLDEEGTVVDLKPAKGTEKGAAVLKVRDGQGYEFDVRFKATIEERRRWMANPKMVLGREVVFTYQERSAKGIPRFPIGKCFREAD